MFRVYQPESDYAGQITLSRTRSDDYRPATAGRRANTDPLAASNADMILSPSPTSQPAQPMQSESQSPPGTDTTPSNPQVASLKAIFPDFDEAVILSVLESTNNDHDRALDVLLGMSDPSFVSAVPSRPPQFQPAHTQTLSQEALDEQLARRIALEEEQAASRVWQPQDVPDQTAYQSYQPRRGARWGGQSQPQPQGQPQGPGGRDTMAEFQEGFNRIAESGKKTFTSIVSKVKAKMQEYEQGQGWSGFSGASSNVPPNQSSAQAQGSYYQSYAPSGQQGPGQGAYTQPPNSQWQTTQPLAARGPTPSWTRSRTSTQSFSPSSPPRSGVLRPSSVSESEQTVSAQQSSYYDPNAPGYDLYGDEDETPIILRDATTAAVKPTATQSTAPLSTGIPLSAFDSPSVNSPEPPAYKSGTSSPNSRPSSTTPPTLSLSPTSGSAVYVPAGASTTTSPARMGTSGAVDFSKLGLLPKRPISLVRPQSPPTSGATGATAPRMAPAHSESSTASTTDEQEEPEYVENPFEDRK